MDYFRIKTIEDLSDLHNQAYVNTSQSTKSTFLQSMKRIQKLYGKELPDIKLSFVDNPNELLELMDKSNYSENTKLTTITNILKLLKLIDAPLITYNNWLNILKTKTEERHSREADKLKQKLSVLVDFKHIRQTVIDKAHTYESDENMELEKFRNFMILSLFTLQIPVRVSNFVGMKVVDSEAFMDDKSNYLLLKDEDYKMVFNKYRTSHLIGKKTINIANETLKFLLDKWLAKYNTSSPNLFIVSDTNKRAMNSKQIEEGFKSASKLLMGSELSVENLRASYMRYIAEIDPDLQDKIEIASIMGYVNTNKIDQHGN